MIVSQKWQTLWMESQHHSKNILNRSLPSSQQTQKVLEDLIASCGSSNRTVQLEALKCWRTWINNQTLEDWKLNMVCCTAVKPLPTKKVKPLDVDICTLKLSLMWTLIIKVEDLMELKGPQYILEVFLQSCLTCLSSTDGIDNELSVLVYQLLYTLLTKTGNTFECENERFPVLTTDILSKKVFYRFADNFLNVFTHWRKIRDKTIIIKLWKSFLERCEVSCDQIPLPVWHKVFNVALQICSEESEPVGDRLGFLHGCSIALKSVLSSSEFMDYGDLSTTPCEVLLKNLIELCTTKCEEDSRMFHLSRDISQRLSAENVAIRGYEPCIALLSELDDFQQKSLYWGVWCGLAHVYKTQLVHIPIGKYTKPEVNFYRKLRQIAVNFDLDKEHLQEEPVLEVERYIGLLNITCYRTTCSSCELKTQKEDVKEDFPVPEAMEIDRDAESEKCDSQPETVGEKSSVEPEVMDIGCCEKPEAEEENDSTKRKVGDTNSPSKPEVKPVERTPKEEDRVKDEPDKAVVVVQPDNDNGKCSPSLETCSQLNCNNDVMSEQLRKDVLKVGTEEMLDGAQVEEAKCVEPEKRAVAPKPENEDFEEDVVSTPTTRSKRRAEEQRESEEAQKRKKRKSFEVIVQEIIGKNKLRKTEKNGKKRKSPMVFGRRERRHRITLCNSEEIKEKKIVEEVKKEKEGRTGRTSTDGKLENYFKVIRTRRSIRKKDVGEELKKIENNGKSETGWRQTSLMNVLKEQGERQSRQNKKIEVIDEEALNRKKVIEEPSLLSLSPFKEVFHDHEYTKRIERPYPYMECSIKVEEDAKKTEKKVPEADPATNQIKKEVISEEETAMDVVREEKSCELVAVVAEGKSSSNEMMVPMEKKILRSSNVFGDKTKRDAISSPVVVLDKTESMTKKEERVLRSTAKKLETTPTLVRKSKKIYFNTEERRKSLRSSTSVVEEEKNDKTKPESNKTTETDVVKMRGKKNLKKVKTDGEGTAASVVELRKKTLRSATPTTKSSNIISLSYVEKENSQKKKEEKDNAQNTPIVEGDKTELVVEKKVVGEEKRILRKSTKKVVRSDKNFKTVSDVESDKSKLVNKNEKRTLRSSSSAGNGVLECLGLVQVKKITRRKSNVVVDSEKLTNNTEKRPELVTEEKVETRKRKISTGETDENSKSEPESVVEVDNNELVKEKKENVVEKESKFVRGFQESCESIPDMVEGKNDNGTLVEADKKILSDSTNSVYEKQQGIGEELLNIRRITIIDDDVPVAFVVEANKKTISDSINSINEKEQKSDEELSNITAITNIHDDVSVASVVETDNNAQNKLPLMVNKVDEKTDEEVSTNLTEDNNDVEMPEANVVEADKENNLAEKSGINKDKKEVITETFSPVETRGNVEMRVSADVEVDKDVSIDSSGKEKDEKVEEERKKYLTFDGETVTGIDVSKVVGADNKKSRSVSETELNTEDTSSENVTEVDNDVEKSEPDVVEPDNVISNASDENSEEESSIVETVKNTEKQDIVVVENDVTHVREGSPINGTEKENVEVDILTDVTPTRPKSDSRMANGNISSRAFRMLALVQESRKPGQWESATKVEARSTCQKSPNLDRNSRASKMLALLTGVIPKAVVDDGDDALESDPKEDEIVTAKHGAITTPKTNLKSPNSNKKRKSIRFDEFQNEVMLYEIDTPPSQIHEEKRKMQRDILQRKSFYHVGPLSKMTSHINGITSPDQIY